MKKKSNAYLRRNLELLLAPALGITIILPSHAGVEKPIDFSELPGEIVQLASQSVPSAKFSSANTEKETDGTFVYEIQGQLSDGRKIEVDIFPSGEIEEIEVEFTVDLVPGAVIQAIQDKIPGFEVSYIEASHSASKKVIQYEFVGKKEGLAIDLEVSADGRKIVIADQ